MSCILNIETSTHVCSVALAKGGDILFERVSTEGPSHAVLLGCYVEEALSYAKKADFTIDAVAVSAGPGSYTGLRIGVSVAKGICFGSGIPLIAVPTLEILASKAVLQANDSDALYCPMLDARRMEVYDAVFDARLDPLKETSADIITPDTFAGYLDTGKQVYFFGNGAPKCKTVITAPNAVFIDGLDLLASDMVPLSMKACAGKQFVDVAYYEPFYLKEFVATIAKNKVLGQ